MHGVGREQGPVGARGGRNLGDDPLGGVRARYRARPSFAPEAGGASANADAVETPFEVTESGNRHGYTKFRAHAVLNHRGDMSAAARALLKET